MVQVASTTDSDNPGHLVHIFLAIQGDPGDEPVSSALQKTESQRGVASTSSTVKMLAEGTRTLRDCHQDHKSSKTPRSSSQSELAHTSRRGVCVHATPLLQACQGGQRMHNVSFPSVLPLARESVPQRAMNLYGEQGVGDSQACQQRTRPIARRPHPEEGALPLPGKTEPRLSHP